LFEKYIDFISPPWILILGTSGMKYLGSDLTITDEISIKGKARKINSYKGILFGKSI